MQPHGVYESNLLILYETYSHIFHSFKVDSSFINSADVLNEAQQLSPPQDFRPAIFFIGAVQKSPMELKKDVDHLRKKYIVQMDTNKQGVFSITFSNGMTIEMAAHPCYPYVSDLCTNDSSMLLNIQYVD